ncbi:hypothetical protein FJTKL_09764 [Diaporthe vaccinii]|uniref:Uncharacterized protein n=1 Tax=Diaporthe vaccinii TaxID=105482 RepID=A0ABR4EMR7_9PEZI
MYVHQLQLAQPHYSLSLPQEEEKTQLLPHPAQTPAEGEEQRSEDNTLCVCSAVKQCPKSSKCIVCPERHSCARMIKVVWGGSTRPLGDPVKPVFGDSMRFVSSKFHLWVL